MSDPPLSPRLLEALESGGWEKLTEFWPAFQWAQDRALAERCAGSLLEFIKEFWDVVEPGRPFVDGWHLHWLCAELEAVTRGETIRLLLNVAPGAMKSLLVSVFWPAWEWGPRGLPSMRYLLAAYTQDLTVRDNRRCKAILQSDKYKRLWPDVIIDPRRTSDENFANTKTGWRIATSPGGLGTGERADRIIIDDPHSVKTAESQLVREETLRWWREVIPTRVNDPQKSAMVVIMQRVHEDDVSGDILNNRGPEWVHVMIPMEYDPGRHCVTPNGEDPRTQEGELYWPERFPEWTVERDKIPLGRFGVASQFQQIPAPREGGLVLREWWQPWPPSGEEERWAFEVDGKKVYGYPPWEYVMAYLDTSVTEAESNAWQAFVRFGVFADSAGRPKVMMASAWRDRMTINQLAHRVLAACRSGSVDCLVIENKMGGSWVKQELERLMRGGEFSIVLDDPRSDKGARLLSVQPLFEHGIVYAPDRDWADMVIDEVASFPKGKWRDLCLVAGTMIATKRGNVPIEEVLVGDYALTPAGWRLVTDSAYTGWTKVIDRGFLEGTPRHPVFSLDGGYHPLDIVSVKELGRLTLCGLIRTIRRRRLISTESASTGLAVSGDIMEERSRGGSLGYTSLFGRAGMVGWFRTATRSITSTTTLLILAMAIWSAYRRACIEGWLRGTIRNAARKSWMQPGHWLRSGIVLLKGKLGIGGLPTDISNWRERSFGFTAFLSRQMAFATGAAARSTTGTSDAGFAARNAGGSIRTSPEGAQGESQSTSYKMVYNLTVAEERCYYANGVLVHNCDCVSGALGYLRRGGLIALAAEFDEEKEERLRWKGRSQGAAERYGV